MRTVRGKITRKEFPRLLVEYGAEVYERTAHSVAYRNQFDDCIRIYDDGTITTANCKIVTLNLEEAAQYMGVLV